MRYCTVPPQIAAATAQPRKKLAAAKWCLFCCFQINATFQVNINGYIIELFVQQVTTIMRIMKLQTI